MMRTVKNLYFSLIVSFLLINLCPRLAMAIDVQMPFSSDADTVLLIHFDEGSGDPKDSSGKGNHSIIHEAEWVTNGKFGGALQFYGEGEYVDIGDKENLDVDTGSFTIEAWVKLPTDFVSIGATIFSKGGIDYHPGYSFLIFNRHLRLDLCKFPGEDPSFYRPMEGTKEVEAGSWHHVACVYNSKEGKVTFYIDGMQDRVISISLEGETLKSNIKAAIGVCPPRNINQFDGVIDELRVSKVARYNSDFKIKESRSKYVEAAPELKHDSVTRFLLVEGLLADTYHIDDAVKNLTGSELDKLYYNDNIKGHDGGSIKGLRRKWRDIQKYDVVVLANASIEPLGPEQKSILSEFIRAGGGLFILGGKTAYGNGGIKSSFLDEVLPIEVADTHFDIIPGGSLEKTEDPFIRNQNLPSELVSPYIHRLEVREKASVVVRVGKKPFLVTGTFGKGRVVCIAGTPYGIEPEGKVLFTEWKEWPQLLRDILLWLLQAEK